MSKQPPFRWKKQPIRQGNTRLAATHKLSCGNIEYATAQLIQETGLWFWYGMGHNTFSSPGTLEQVKREALDVARAGVGAGEPPDA